MFENELRQYVGMQVQVVTPGDSITGMLVSVSEGAVVLRTAQYPGYGGAEDVTVLIGTISYVRVFE